ncbi:flagellar protein FlaG [uncultured Desulfuromusa sp.]|uniref:flagellar protein FlaG n=1 Tax=uncultured Desulfuromusa sp. TaxID=219183 RepID=UPI002AA6FB66|nr:flagellar protein FlaG [uncultured Desulfuromusa sp.]
MIIESTVLASATQSQFSKGSEQVDEGRKKTADLVQSEQVEKKQVQPEELLKQIKALTEEGLYSVRFENDERANGLVVQIVDRQNDEVIRQVPAEEILDLKVALEDLRGNLVNTES